MAITKLFCVTDKRESKAVVKVLCYRQTQLHYPRSEEVSREKSIKNVKIEVHSPFYRLGNLTCKRGNQAM